MTVPNRHRVAWHVMWDGAVIDAVGALAHFARVGFGGPPGPVSPHVHWWNGSSYEQLTHIDADGTTSVHAGPEFTALLEEPVGDESC